ncbi:uncharacterized protein G2W53_010748 [Senna tora]|uniref:Uncharacterized protein n=1 Tax=Senna tora TaxID=362788 RepID=A0A835CA36_9FABA|nr:uncharacterized protein G2W53_010748 [Senna tora]
MASECKPLRAREKKPLWRVYRKDNGESFRYNKSN